MTRNTSPDRRAPLIDVHAHFVTDHYVSLAKAAGHEHPDGMPGWPTWDVASHLELIDRGGIATAMLSVSSPSTHFGDNQAASDRHPRSKEDQLSG
jgi:hypothetical protein